MSSLLDLINNTRESTISLHYAAAVAELEEKVKSSPCDKQYYIYSGCISKEVTHELARRFSEANVTATASKSITQTWFLLVEPNATV